MLLGIISKVSDGSVVIFSLATGGRVDYSTDCMFRHFF
jgi:hypothetical protein